MKITFPLLLLMFIFSCKSTTHNSPEGEFDQGRDSSAISANDFTDFKVVNSQFLNPSEIWAPFEQALSDFSEEKYIALKPYILDQDIPTIQSHIDSRFLSYELLTKFYLYRIRKFDRHNPQSLNAVISLNPQVITEAKARDKALKNAAAKPLIFGMPILLKDNIGAQHMPTTAGAVAFKENNADNAFIVKRLEDQGAVILGKVNLSEWAYFFCTDCPSGYSAIGGQTLNPYGRRSLDTGGSSSGSGVAVAANFCVASIGTETSGSIISPASQNSVVGLKPTVGLLSRGGIVPISSTLDTPGPITKNVVDNAIVLDAMVAYDPEDPKSFLSTLEKPFYDAATFVPGNFTGQRFGAIKTLLSDSLYAKAVSDLKMNGAQIIEIEVPEIDLPNFLRLLNLDMKVDFTSYLALYADPNLPYTSLNDIISFNKKDSIDLIPYGQKLLRGVVNDKASEQEYDSIKTILKFNGRLFFNQPMEMNKLDAILSINNYHSGFAAVAEYPTITVPMGYAAKGEPKGLTFIGKPLSEHELLHWAYLYEQNSKRRVPPKNYR